MEKSKALEALNDYRKQMAQTNRLCPMKAQENEPVSTPCGISAGRVPLYARHGQ